MPEQGRVSRTAEPESRACHHESGVEEPIPELKGRCVLHFIASMPNDSTNIGVGYGIDGLLDMLLLDPQYDDISVTNRDGLSSQFNLWKERMI